MCGIFGFWLNRPLNERDITIGRRGCDALRHRGPDGSGEWIDERSGVYLGHRRLSIIDLSDASGQPMIINDIVISFNGELYNYVELREILRKYGHKFNTSGDTEIFVKSWQHWGEVSLEKFDGMFACALWDGESIHLVSDPFGEKPIYWIRTVEGFYFSSEANVLIDILGLKFSPSQEEVDAFLCLGFMAPPYTGYKDLNYITPATHITLSHDSAVKQSRYWELPQGEVHRGRVRPLSKQAIDQIHECLLDSLSVRIRSDVPLGVFLSSGVDSTLVATLIAKELKQDITALTVSFLDGRDESQEASNISEYLNIKHNIINSLNDDSWRRAPQYLESIYGVPNDNYTSSAVYQMSCTAKKYITVALTGLGGDEVFYGYNKYHFLYKWRQLYSMPEFVCKQLMYLGKVFANNIKLEQLSNYLLGNNLQRYIALKNDGLGRTLEQLSPSIAKLISNSLTEKTDLAYQVRNFDMRYTLPGSFIPAVERGSMRASLEVRTPFLSRSLLATISGFDQRVFLKYGQKTVLRQILDRYMPRGIINTGKQGFIYPIDRYLTTCSENSPRHVPLSDRLIDEIWTRRERASYRPLAMRLKILELYSSVT